jgi:hypothetical protein
MPEVHEASGKIHLNHKKSIYDTWNMNLQSNTTMIKEANALQKSIHGNKA